MSASSPLSIAVIGASTQRDRFANKAVRAFVDAGYTVYPVHPKESMVEGLTCYTTVADIPGALDAASLYVTADVGVTLLPALREKGVTHVYVNPGAQSAELLAGGRDMGLDMRPVCSIRAIGKVPAEYP